MEWIELTLKPHTNDKKSPRKVMQRVDQIGDIYIDADGYTNISPIYMQGEDYLVMESYEDVQRALKNHANASVFEVSTREEREEELNQIKKRMIDHGYSLSEM